MVLIAVGGKESTLTIDCCVVLVKAGMGDGPGDAIHGDDNKIKYSYV